MKSINKVFVSAIFFSILFIFNGCKDDENDSPPDNLLTSTTGINVSLTWLTGSTATQAPIDADLDLRVYDKSNIMVSDLPQNWSENTDAFENLTLSSTLPDGDYYILVLMYENFAGKAISFTLNVSSAGKEVKATGNYADTKMLSNGNYAGPDTNLTVRSVMKITKSGNNFTVIKL
jgi:hypothetical protein